MKRLATIALLSTLTTLASPADAQVPAFPGAEGAGMWSEGGRFGAVYEVTNLDDDGPGSLREAVEAAEPRFVVFRISGNIELASTLSIRNPRIYVAGQTAPGDGITLKNYPLTIRTDHVIVRYIRVRPGDDEGQEVDSLSITEGSKIIVDHCSTSWSVDETLSASTDGQLDEVTVQWCVISESLHCSVHSEGCHGMGSLIRGAWGNHYSFHHNLYAHHNERSPRPGNYNDYLTDPDGFLFDFRNNVVYNWGGSYAGYNSDADSITKMNFVGNYYVAGPDSTGNLAYRESCTYARGYFADNAMDGSVPGDPWDLVQFSGFTGAEETAYKQSSAFDVVPVTTETADAAFVRVLAEAGVTWPQRDAVDERIIDDVQNGTGSIIDDELEVGGWPDLQSTAAPPDRDHDGMPDDFETANGFDPDDPSDGNEDCDSDGYTNIEEYLNGGPTASACSGAGGSGGTGAGGTAGSGGQGLSGGAGGEAASSGSGGSAGSGGPPQMSESTADDGGCDCRTRGSSGSMDQAWWLALAIYWIASRRRRRC